MKSNRKFTKNSAAINRKNLAAFTGLEAAIVLIAFVVVAAVFSYVMLGAGFFTSQKSKEVVHTGVDQATSSMQIAGDVIGIGGFTSDDAVVTTGGVVTTPPTLNKLDGVIVTVSLTAGNNPVDLSKMVVSYATGSSYEDNIYSGMPSTQMDTASDIYNDGTPTTDGGYQFVVNLNSDNMLDKNEKVQLNLPFPRGAVTEAAAADGTDKFVYAARHLVTSGTTAFAEERPGAGSKVSIDIKPATGADLLVSFSTPTTIENYMVLA